jgi:hypothetical protein
MNDYNDSLKTVKFFNKKNKEFANDNFADMLDLWGGNENASTVVAKNAFMLLTNLKIIPGAENIITIISISFPNK